MAKILILVVLAACSIGVESQSDGCEAEYFASVGTTGHLSSINYPQDYDNNYECGSVITASSGQKIRLDFASFDLEFYTGCVYDSLEIRDGDNINSTLIGTYCGDSNSSAANSSAATPGVIESSGSALFLFFQSDGTTAEAGYTATFEAFGDVSESCWIQHEKTKYTGTILATVYSAEHVLAVCDMLNCVAYSCHAKPEKKGCNIYSEISGEASKKASKKYTSHVQGPCEV